jgi:streptogramin lyase
MGIMRASIGVCLAIWLLSALLAADDKKDAKHTAPRAGIQTPGVQIPFASLKAEAEVAAAPAWIGVADVLLLPNAANGALDRLEVKTNKLAGPIDGLSKPCGDAIAAFGSVWVPSCEGQSLVRLDPKTWKVTAKAATGVGIAQPALAASADSVWVLSDNKSTLSRVDPDQNLVVAELCRPAATA